MVRVNESAYARTGVNGDVIGKRTASGDLVCMRTVSMRKWKFSRGIDDGKADWP